MSALGQKQGCWIFGSDPRCLREELPMSEFFVTPGKLITRCSEIAACRVYCDFEPAGQRLAKLVASHQQSLAVRLASRMKFALLGIRLVVAKPILS